MNFPLPAGLVNMVDRSLALNGTPFDPATTMAVPHGRYTTVHYGIMVPNLPPPYNFLNIITIIGQPKVKLFRNAHLIRTTDLDTANLLIGTGVGTPDHFKGYGVKESCAFHKDGSFLRFGNDLVIEGVYPRFSAHREGAAFNFDLTLEATDKVAHFAKLIGGLYDHWGILCTYQGQIVHDGRTIPIDGLCTFEYARAVNLPLPFLFFSYQIINIDASTQALFVQVLGPMNMPIQRRVYIRSLDHHGGVYTKGFDFTVHEFEPDTVTTPNGQTMQLPSSFSWRVDDEMGHQLIRVNGITNRDFQYGMAGGYAGSFGYHGHYKGNSINGTGYIEYIDCR